MSRTQRFSAQPVDQPGPGTYNPNKGDSGLINSSNSISRKGYGSGFVSREDRFARTFLSATAAADNMARPGPGHYDSGSATAAFPSTSATGDISSSASVSMRRPVPGVGFSSSSRCSRVPPSLEEVKASGNHAVPKSDPMYFSTSQETPGPGAYEPTLPSASLLRLRRPAPPHLIPSRLRQVQMQERSRPRFAPPLPVKEDGFLTSSTRFADTSTPTPAPGDYYVTPSMNVSASTSTLSAATGFASVFRSQTQRSSLTAKTLGGTLDTPGPGSYNTSSAALPRAGLAVAEPATMAEPPKNHIPLYADPSLPSSMFALRTSDRFGRPLNPRVRQQTFPGPGTYDPPSTIGSSPSSSGTAGLTFAPPQTSRRPAPPPLGASLTGGNAHSTNSSSQASAAQSYAHSIPSHTISPGPGWYDSDLPTSKSFRVTAQFPAPWV